MKKDVKTIILKDGEVLEIIAKDNRKAKIIVFSENNKLCIDLTDK